MTSYAQNLEDVMIWRALKFLKCGTYIDIGSMDPTVDSVTRWLYDQGWSGLNIEPNPYYFDRLLQQRTRDINLCVAVGGNNSIGELYVCDEPGLTTIDNNIALAHRQNGRTFAISKVIIKTLDNIISEYINGPIHLLKIDAEGKEQEILEHMNIEKNKPWIVLIEVVDPVSRFERKLVRNNLKGFLESHNYSLEFHDGINDYYVSGNHSYLTDAFQYPPNVFDNFTLYRTVKAELQVNYLNHVIIQHVNEIQAIKNTLSWRITNPLRMLKQLYKTFVK